MKLVKNNATAVTVYCLLVLMGCGGGDGSTGGNEARQDDPPDIVTTDTDGPTIQAPPDIMGNTNFYPKPVNTGLLSGPLIGQNTASDNIAARSVPFSYSGNSISPVVVQRIVSASFIEGGIPQHQVIMTLKNTSNSLVCGQNITYSFKLTNGTIRGGTPSGEGLEQWHGSTVQEIRGNSTFALSRCIQPNSHIYVTREIPDTVSAAELSSVIIYKTNLRNFSPSIILNDAITNVLPTAYTISTLPESDPRVEQATDEFIIVTVVNNTATSQTIPGGASLILLDANGYPLARLTAKAKNLTEFLSPPPIEPGAEQEIIFRNDVEAGVVSSVRFISRAKPTDL